MTVGAIDVHSHLLPGIDDGAPDWETSLKMARVAVADGIGTIVATPHWPLDRNPTAGPRVRALVVEAQERLTAAELPLRVLPGHELAVSWEMEASLATGDALPLGDSHFLLLETPYLGIPPYLRDLLFRLQSCGYRPILAHPERNADVQDDPRCLEELVDAGCLLQVNAGSVLGQFGSRPQRTAMKLMTRGWVQLLASDAHSPKGRPPRLEAAAQMAAKWIGSEAAQSLIGAGPFAVVQDMMPPPFCTPRPAGWLPGLLGRFSRG